MKRTRKIRHVSIKELVSVVVMAASLWFLTGVNFFLFPLNEDPVSIMCSTDERAPQGPVEEKAPENKSITSIQEEYLHEQALLELAWFNRLSNHKIHTAEKLRIVYYEIVSPPPKA